jgi:hypothetical protein
MQMTFFRVQKLESLGFEWEDDLGFEWKPHNSDKKGIPKNTSLDDDATRVLVRAVEAPEQVQAIAQTQEDLMGREIQRNQVEVAFEPVGSDWNGEAPFGYIPGETAEI